MVIDKAILFYFLIFFYKKKLFDFLNNFAIITLLIITPNIIGHRDKLDIYENV